MNEQLLKYVELVTIMRVMDYKPLLVMHHESVTTMVLHRHEQFQTELIIAHPAAKPWPGEHRHPNVDTVELELIHCVGFTKNGKVVVSPDFIINGVKCVHLGPDDWHGTPYMPLGSSLLSVQLWLNGKQPTSVGLDWEGEPISEGHAKQIGEIK